MIQIYWDDTEHEKVPYNVLTEVIRLGLTRAEVSNCEISISFVEPDEIRQLNKAYRNIDKTTDVLSFPGYINGMIQVPDDEMPKSLGDIVICTAIAQEQAKAYGHSVEREMAFLTAHGLLHLLGYDHDEDEQAMCTEQDTILGALGIVR